jgi:hypothetical protein
VVRLAGKNCKSILQSEGKVSKRASGARSIATRHCDRL